MHSLFGNDKESQSIHDQNKHYKNIFLEFNRRYVYILASQLAYDNLFLKIDSALSDKFDSKNKKLESMECQQNHPYIEYFKRFESCEAKFFEVEAFA